MRAGVAVLIVLLAMPFVLASPTARFSPDGSFLVLHNLEEGGNYTGNYTTVVLSSEGEVLWERSVPNITLAPVFLRTYDDLFVIGRELCEVVTGPSVLEDCTTGECMSVTIPNVTYRRCKGWEFEAFTYSGERVFKKSGPDLRDVAFFGDTPIVVYTSRVVMGNRSLLIKEPRVAVGSGVYVASGGRLIAFNENFEKVWEKGMRATVVDLAALEDGVAVATFTWVGNGTLSSLHVIDGSGEELFSFEEPGPRWAFFPRVLTAGKYIAFIVQTRGSDSEVRAHIFTASGEHVWSANITGGSFTTFRLSRDGTLFVNQQSRYGAGRVMAFKGGLLWSVDLTKPAVDFDVGKGVVALVHPNGSFEILPLSGKHEPSTPREEKKEGPALAICGPGLVALFALLPHHLLNLAVARWEDGH